MGALRAPFSLRQGSITEAGLLPRVAGSVEAGPGLGVEGGADDEALQGHDGGPQLEHVRGQLLDPAPRMRTTRGHDRLKCHNVASQVTGQQLSWCLCYHEGQVDVSGEGAAAPLHPGGGAPLGWQGAGLGRHRGRVNQGDVLATQLGQLHHLPRLLQLLRVAPHLPHTSIFRVSKNNVVSGKNGYISFQTQSQYKCCGGVLENSGFLLPDGH